MINMPLADIMVKIKEKSSLSDEDIKKKIKDKMKQLSGLISEEGAAHIIANELGIRLVPMEGKLQVKNILAGMRSVEVIGRVVKKYEVRDFTSGEREGKVGSFILGDDSGIIRVVLWNDQADNFSKFKENDIIHIKSAYVKENNGRKEMHLNDSSKLLINPENVNVAEKPSSVRKKLNELTEQDDDVEVLATIVQLFDPKFFEVCPDCGSRAKPDGESFMCAKHGKIKPNYAYVLNAFLDDGSDSIRSVFWRRQAQQLLDMTDAKIQEFRLKPESFEPLKTELLGNIIKITGRINKNQNFDRLELVAENVVKNPDPDEEIENLKKEAKKSDGIKPSQETLKAAEQIEKASKKADDADEELISIDELEDNLE